MPGCENQTRKPVLGRCPLPTGNPGARSSLQQRAEGSPGQPAAGSDVGRG